MADPGAKTVSQPSLDDAAQARLDAVAEAEIDARHGVRHEKVREWLAKLARGERIDPPLA